MMPWGGYTDGSKRENYLYNPTRRQNARKTMGVIYRYSLEKTRYSDPFLPGSAYQPSDKGSGRPVSAQSQ
jgi:hypothetical protein